MRKSLLSRVAGLLAFPASLATLLVACSSSSGTGTGGTGGGAGSANAGMGGSASGGGATGGTTGSGGSSASGGSTGAGGSSASGGSTGAGGSSASGGSTGTGGSTGMAGSGGAGGRVGTGGSSGTAGTGGTGGAGAGAGGQAGTFALSWQDDFNTLDLTSWQLQTFSFGGSLAQFATQNATVANGILTIALTPAPGDTMHPYRGVEMRSTKTLTYGKVSARMRFAKGSGVVSGLVLFYTPFPNCNWNEIDIEHLGASSTTSQLNCMVYTGTPVPNCATSVTPTQDPLIVNLGVDAEADFHQYDVEWTPAGVSFLVDGRLLRTWTANIKLMTLPQTILLTIWASNTASWAGPLLPTSAPTSADVDWIKVYSWQP